MFLYYEILQGQMFARLLILRGMKNQVIQYT